MEARKLRPGAATYKKRLNKVARGSPTVPASNFFPGNTKRPTVNVVNSVNPSEVSTSNLFPGPKKPSAFNKSHSELVFHKKQQNAFKNSQSPGKNYIMPMNHIGGRRTRKRK